MINNTSLRFYLRFTQIPVVLVIVKGSTTVVSLTRMSSLVLLRTLTVKYFATSAFRKFLYS